MKVGYVAAHTALVRWNALPWIPVMEPTPSLASDEDRWFQVATIIILVLDEGPGVEDKK